MRVSDTVRKRVSCAVSEEAKRTLAAYIPCEERRYFQRPSPVDEWHALTWTQTERVSQRRRAAAEPGGCDDLCVRSMYYTGLDDVGGVCERW